MDDPETRERFKRAVALHQEGRLSEADALYAEILAAHPDFAEALHLKGVIAYDRQNYDGALAMISRAMALKPGAAAFHHNIAGVYGTVGRLDLAEEHMREAIRLQPDYAEAYFNLTGLVRIAAGDPLFDAVEAMLANNGLSGTERCHLHFAAAKMYDDLGDYERAFEHYRAGNGARDVTFDAADLGPRAEAMIEAFPATRMAAQGERGDPARLPVFIVGMPRSGTSLAEQILASHPRIFGAGELPDIPSIVKTLPRHGGGGAYPGCVGGQGPEVFEGFAASYLQRIAPMAPGARRIVDKNPLNFEHLGLISLMFPGAAIIHCRRHPLDTCVSCYFQNFRKDQEYSFDMENLALFYRFYVRLMAHWLAVLPNPILELRYENLIADSEGRARTMLAHCGVEWDDACATPHRTDRPVATASRWQARQPLYATSVARWRRYERHIGPLADLLGPLVEAYERGGNSLSRD